MPVYYDFFHKSQIWLLKYFDILFDMKKLYRSEDNRIWKGVIGGFGEYFNIDPVLLRIVFIFFVLATGIVPGVITYIIAILIIPKKKIQEAEVVEDQKKTSA